MTNGVCTFDPATHTYTIDGTPAVSVSATLETAGLKVDYPGVADSVRQRATTRGTYIHDACDAYDLGDLDWAFLDEKCADWANEVKAYRLFREHEGFAPSGPVKLEENGAVTFEHRVWSKELGIAGTLDRIGTWNGERCIVDLKSGARVYWPTRYQTALYALLGLLMAKTELGMPMREAFQKTGRLAVHLKKDGTYAITDYRKATKEVPEPHRDLDVVLGAVLIVQAQRAHRVKMPTADAP